ncbi:hypothetical protein PFISCL1PPCAC_11194, partial [Pristionchus fissidentatus]
DERGGLQQTAADDALLPSDDAIGGTETSRRRKTSASDIPDTDSGRPTSVDDEEEDDPAGGLVLHIPPRPDSEIKNHGPAEIKDQSTSGAEIKEQSREIRRIPTLVCEELRDEEEEGTDQPSSSSRRVQRALSKQCVIDDDTVPQPTTHPLSIVIDTRSEPKTAKEKSKTLTPTPSLTADQWESMADRRRELAAQLLGRTPLSLSQSEGNLERAKTKASIASKTGGNAKLLVRSHALCGDDDTRLRPPAEFARSNPSFAATKSLSRDSSATDYTDSSGVDLFAFIVTTLHKNEKDRSILLDLERQLIDYVKDESRQSYRFAPMSSYNRMLIHRVAAYFGLDHNIDQSGQCIVVNRSENTRIPEHNFASLIRSDQYTDTARRSLSRDAQSYEEISREYPSLPHRMSLEMLSRRTRSFEVSGHRTLSPAWRNEQNAQSTDSAPSLHPHSSNSPAYALSPVMQQNAEAPEERPDGAALEPRRRVAGLAQLHKAGSFGGVPVFYRNNSNGVRPIEETMMRGRERNGGMMGQHQQRSESQRSRPESQPEQQHQHQPEYYGSGQIPPDPYYREEQFRSEFNGNVMQQNSYYQSDPNRQLYVDTYGTPAGAPPMEYAPAPYYYPTPTSQPMQQQFQQHMQQAPDQVDQLAREMSAASISSNSQSQSPTHMQQLQQPHLQLQQPRAPVFYPQQQPMMQPAFYAPVYQGYAAMPAYDGFIYAPMQYHQFPAPPIYPQPAFAPVPAPNPMAYHNGTTYYHPVPHPQPMTYPPNQNYYYPATGAMPQYPEPTAPVPVPAATQDEVPESSEADH